MLEHREIKDLISRYGQGLIVYIIRETIADARANVQKGNETPGLDRLVSSVCQRLKELTVPSLKPVINATGVVLHTNLGRAPLGEKVLEDTRDIILGYSNLEYDLNKAARGKRNHHVIPLLKAITGAEDAIVVNNNAAGLMLALHTLAYGKEVIVSRGELVEIGGSFRIPEIMAASGAKMIEIGTTNKTHLKDYETAINEHTALILKVHKSNYTIQGFTEEVSLKSLVKLARSRQLPVLYDIGSGLLRRPGGLLLGDEPDVKTSIAEGADLVAFSGDKLLGGPQAGIVAGKREWIQQLNQAPMMRALRVGKLTLAALSSVTRSYLDDETLKESLPLFSILEQSREMLEKKAGTLVNKLTELGIDADIVPSVGQCGGGTLPMLNIESFAVVLVSDHETQKERSLFAERVFKKLVHLDYPIIGILRQGEFLLDVLTLKEDDFPYIASVISSLNHA
ncbi:MAG: L-seryl-tRNA(Sec) selenium transferase [bacterium]|nr:L-seryl-tRNA(Sec) selenium transferase [bacterium]